MGTIHQVTLPVGESRQKQFECSSEESILQAGLRSGIALRYKCINGSCGECKSRLLAGEITPIQHQDLPLSAQEQQQGWFLSCTHAARSDLDILAPLFDTPLQIPQQQIQTRVKRVELLEEAQIAILTLRTPRSNTLQFLAGQDVVLSHLLVSKRYPIASCPCNGGELEFHIPRRQKDPFSQLLFSSLKRGESVALEGPHGMFTLDEHSGRHLVFIAWESGFAPVRSLLEHFISLQMSNPVSLYWISSERPYQHNRARSWSTVLDPYDYQWISPADEGTDDGFEHSTEALLQLLQQDLPVEMCDFYIAAPATLLIHLSERLSKLGVAEQQLHASPISFQPR